MSKVSFSSEFFEIQELADGVYAAVGPQEGLCHSNAGIVDLGDRTLVFDTLTLPSYGEDLARACREFTGREPSWIALSHFHSDHWLGNQAFDPQTPILATHGMQPQLAASMEAYETLPNELDDFAGQIEELEVTCKAETDAKKRQGIETNLSRYRALHAQGSALRVIPANTFFEGTIKLSGSARSIELVEVKGAHTVSDVYLSIPEDKIVFMGDLGFFDTIPFLMFADPLGWIECLKALEASDARVFVPGHGIVSDTDRVKRSRECIEAIVQLVRATLDAGEKAEESLLRNLPFKTWAEGRTWMQQQLDAVASSISGD